MEGVSERRLRIGYFGDGPWANRALQHIAEDSRLEVAFVTPRHGNPDAGLRSWAIRLGVPFISDPDVNSRTFLDRTKACTPDIFVSMSFDQIVKRQFIDETRYGAINCHAGALPFYRGRNPLNWALINGEGNFGITVHYIDEGIDTGDIIVQRFSPISQADTYADLLARAHDLCASTLLEALGLICEGEAPRIRQADVAPQHTYFSSRRPGDEWIDWNWSSQRIFNFIRAITVPGPCARSLIGERHIAIVEASMAPSVPAHIGSNGEVVGRSPAGNLVKTGDTGILITKVAEILPDGTLDVVTAPRFPIGTRFGNSMLAEIVALRQRVADLERKLGSNL